MSNRLACLVKKVLLGLKFEWPSNKKMRSLKQKIRFLCVLWHLVYSSLDYFAQSHMANARTLFTKEIIIHVIHIMDWKFNRSFFVTDR